MAGSASTGIAVTHFHRTAQELSRLLHEAAVDHVAFERPMKLCGLARCRATCCHDGVILSDEEAEFLGAASGDVVKDGSGKWRTRTRAAAPEELADDFPAHFPRTRCVFLDDEHRCHWQLRSVEEGRSAWYYKPVSCWMHPLVLERREGRVVLTILSSTEDRARFASVTPCGREEDGGVVARECLRSELEMLQAISGRDFYGELNAPLRPV
jgi:hypothetical protein